MTRSVLQDGFAHHVWATLRLLDVCRQLDEDQLATAAAGTYGSIIDTLGHIVAGDRGYLFALTGGRLPRIDETGMSVVELREVMGANGEAWMSLVTGDLDPDTIVVRHHDDGSATQAPLGIRLAQALHHGSDHRSQVCTVLTIVGIEPPDIDVWDFAEQDGRLIEVPPPD